MPYRDYEIEVDLSATQAWEKLTDFSAALHYVPGLTAVDITTETSAGVGASRRVAQGSRLVMDETVIEWLDGEGFSLRLHRGDRGPIPPMTAAVFHYRIHERDGRVMLHNAMEYEVGLGFLGCWLDRLAIGKVVNGALRDTTIAQKLWYETGLKVGPEALAAEKARLTR